SVLVLLSGTSFVNAQSATDCSQLGAGYRQATASDPAVQNGQIQAGTCYNPSAAGISADAEQAKEWLFERAQPVSSCGTASKESFEKLQPKFAICAYRALKAFEDQNGGKGAFTISSAYRTQEQQSCVCGGKPVAGKCGSAGETGANGYAINCSGHWH